MYNSKLVNVFYATNDLLENFACLLFLHPFFADYIVEKLSSFHVLHDQKQVLRSLDNLIQLYNVRMTNQL